MNNWTPTFEERRYVECAASMATDTLIGRGVADRATFVANLRAIANGLQRIDRMLERDGFAPDLEPKA